MMNAPYARFKDDKLILRDELAVDRTKLANERTLLAYLRSAISLLIAGATILHFSVYSWFAVLGVLCIPLGIITGSIGVLRYRKMQQAIGFVRNPGGARLPDTDIVQ